MKLYAYELNYIIILEVDGEYFNKLLQRNKFKLDENDEFKLYSTETDYYNKKDYIKIIDVIDVLTKESLDVSKYKLHSKSISCRKSYDLIENDIIEHLQLQDIFVKISKPVILYDIEGRKRTEYYYDNGIQGEYIVYWEDGKIKNKMEFISNEFIRFLPLKT